jgi:hypothetical protein
MKASKARGKKNFRGHEINPSIMATELIRFNIDDTANIKA